MKPFSAYANIVDAALHDYFPERVDEELRSGETAPLLYRAMRYSLLSGGKRVRGGLMLAVADMLRNDPARALPFAMAVEMIHASSLIHDDMPCVDDDILRRGQPTNHVVFGEGQALFAGDALLNMAYEVMLSQLCENAMVAAAEISRGVGRMLSGQCVDLTIEGAEVADGDETLLYIQENKTSAMFEYPLRAMGRLFSAAEGVVRDLGEYGRILGLLFQATDDILDVEGEEDLGKSLHKDAGSKKLTMISLYGLDGAKARAAAYAMKVKEIAAGFPGGAAFFAGFADQMMNRRK